MIAVEFHHNAPDRTAAVCRLIAHRVAQGERLRVYAPNPAAAEALDRALWTFDAQSFVPHCREGADVASDTPVVIGTDTHAQPGMPVLVNFSDAVPPNLENFATLIEVVGQDGADREAARGRFRHYRERGLQLITHDLNEAPNRG